MRRTTSTRTTAITCLVALIATLAIATGSPATATESSRYLVVFAGTQNDQGSFELGGNFDLQYGAALALVGSAGGTIHHDLASQIGVMVVESDNTLFADTLRSSSLVKEVGREIVWKAYPSYEEALARGLLKVVSADGGGQEQQDDPLEPLQWSMQMIRAPEAHDTQPGSRAVDVGILDTGIDGLHLDFQHAEEGTNVDCARGRDFIPEGPGIGNPDPCVDNSFHGTHVGGIVAAQANGVGVVGVAPNVTLVPVKVCDALGFCYAGSVTAGITYAGDARFDVINMSFFMDDDEFMESTELKCMSDPEQAAFRLAGERALAYAQSQGVTPVAALGNSDLDLGPADESPNDCDVVPAESPGVTATMSVGSQSQKAPYSSYGDGATDVAAPGGAGQSGDCANTVLSTLPGNAWGCLQGTSMASPHSAGVAALIVSQFGGGGGSVFPPGMVQSFLQSTTVDIGLQGYDKCFGHGRIDAVRAVAHDTSYLYDPDAPFCPEYEE